MNDVYMVRPPIIVIVLSVLPNRNKIVSQSINQSILLKQYESVSMLSDSTKTMNLDQRLVILLKQYKSRSMFSDSTKTVSIWINDE